MCGEWWGWVGYGRWLQVEVEEEEMLQGRRGGGRGKTAAWRALKLVRESGVCGEAE